ncbi:MAG: intradiol ring-cleavage dioxygenase [Cyclobacteriaceae bacterium]
MKRKDFIKNIGIGTVGSITLTSTLTSCKKDDDQLVTDPTACLVSPSETAGPFPIKTPADFVRENIVGDRVGVPLVINIKIENINDNCEPLVGAFVDIWHCDSKGNYSEYNDQLDGNFTSEHFLRGRQKTDSSGIASFISIYPGWYPGRAPHLHLEILDANGSSILVTQTAFPEEISKTVYATQNYKGDFDTSNVQDGEFRDSLSSNLAESINGTISNGYTLNETVKIAG